MAHQGPVVTAGRRHLPTVAQAVLSAGFCLLLALPALTVGRGGTPENPRLGSRPALSWSRWRSYPREFEQYFNGSFGLRERFVRLHNAVRVFALQTSPLPQVVMGRDGWLFYDGDPVGDGVSLTDFRGGALYPPGAPDRVAVKVATQAAWLAHRGIRYLAVVSPNKESIYPEYLPASAGPRGTRTRLDQVAEALAGQRLPFVDPRAALLEAKRLGPVYYKTDTHWTAFGALVAYREIIARLRQDEPRLAPVRLDDYEIRVQSSTDRPGDITWLLSLIGRFDDWDATAEPRDASWPGESKLGKVLLFRDSFGVTLLPFLARHFGVVVADAGPIDFARIEKEAPDVVIFEVAERYLRTLQRSKTPPGTGSEPGGPGPAERAPRRPGGEGSRG